MSTIENQAAGPSGLLTVEEVAQLLRTPPATLRYWRYLGTGPLSFKLGRRVFYRSVDIDRWLAEQQRSAIGQAIS